MPEAPTRKESTPEKVEKTTKMVELKTLLEWVAPIRPFKRRDRKYFTTIISLVAVLALILIFIREFLLIGVIFSVLFVTYVLATVEPEKTKHKITTHGVTTADQTYPWEELGDFWFTKKFDSTVLNINTKARFPGRLFLIIEEAEREKVRKILTEYLPFRETPPENLVDKISESLASKFSLE